MKLRTMLAGVLMLSATMASAANVPVITPPLTAASQRTGAAVGFVTHPRENYYAQLSDTPAAAELSNIFCWELQGTPTTTSQIQVRFNTPVNWLRQIYNSGRTAYPILDTSIHNAQQSWLVNWCTTAGENLIGADEQPRAWCSSFSPTFKQAMWAYIDQLIDWVKVNDNAHRIPGYTNGAEWFWPAGTMDYSPLALQAWQTWLKARYHNNLAELNTAWGATLGNWTQAAPPRPIGLVSSDATVRTYTINGSSFDIAWGTGDIAVVAGTTYTATVNLTTQNVPEGLAQLQLAWFNTSNTLLSTNNFAPDAELPNRITGQAVAPAAATKAQFLMKLVGPGQVTYSAPTLLNSNNQSLLPAGTGSFWFAEWAGDGDGQSSIVSGKATFSIQVATPPMPYTHTAVALEDWVNFSYEGMAGWLNETAVHIKQRDPSRTVGSYVGFVFGTLCMWDLAMDEQRLDISLANTPDVDVNGIQLCVAGEDYTYATGPLDIARKYGKTLRATDLVDFPWGLYSGFAPIYRGTLAGVQHGLDEVFYYNWYGTPDYAFYALMSDSDRAKMLNGVQAAIAALRNYQPRVELAQLLPMMSYSLADEGGYKSDPLDAGGFYRLAQDAGLSTDLWTPYEIEKQGVAALQRYRAILISDCPVLPATVNSTLVDYVRQGGTVIGSGRAPQKDLRGQSFSTPLVSHELPQYSGTIGQGKVLWTNDKLGRAYWGKVRLNRYYGNTPPVWIPEPDVNRTPAAQQTLRERLQGMLATAGASPRAVLDAATVGVNLALYQQPYQNKWLLSPCATGRRQNPAACASSWTCRLTCNRSRPDPI